MYKIILSILIVTFFYGCTTERDEEYYRNHLNEAQATNAECIKNKTLENAHFRNMSNEEWNCRNSKVAIMKYGTK